MKRAGWSGLLLLLLGLGPPAPPTADAEAWADGASLSGVVVDEDGRPVAGARVTAQQDLPGTGRLIWNRQRAKHVTAETDERGRFRVDGLAPGTSWSIVVRKTGFCSPPLLTRPVPSEERLRLTLQTASSLAGTVLDEAGRPVEGATITVAAMDRRPQPPRRGEARSGVDGRFSMPRQVTAGEVLVRVDHEDYEPFHRRLHVGAPEAEPTPVAVTLRPGRRLVVRVLGPDGRAVEDASVSVRDLAGDLRWQSLESAPYRFRGLAEGPHLLEVRHRRHARVERRVEIPGDGPVSVRLAASHRVEGRVVDEVGEPVRGAQVHALAVRGRRPIYSISTDPQGRFAFHVPDGLYVPSASVGGLTLTSELPPIEVRGPLGSLELRLRPRREVVVTLADLHGENLETFEVWAEGLDGSSGAELRALPNRRAEAHLQLPAGRWQILAEDLATGLRTTTTLELPPISPELQGKRLVVEMGPRTGVPVTGQVRVDGVARGDLYLGLSAAEHGFQQSRARTADDGRFRFSGLPRGRYVLDLRSGDDLRHRQVVEVGQEATRVAIDLQTCRISGRVMEGRSAPPPGTVVSLTRAVVAEPPSPDGGIVKHAATDASGRFELRSVLPGRWRLQARARGRSSVARNIDCANSQKPLALELGPAAPLRLTLASARPLVDRLSYLEEGESQARVAYRRLDGTFLVDDLPEGRHRLSIFHGQGSPIQVEVEAPGAATVELPRGAMLRVLGERSPGGFRLALLDPETLRPALFFAGGLREHREIWRGRIATGLPAGDWLLELTGRDGWSWQGPVRLESGQLTDVRTEGAFTR